MQNRNFHPLTFSFQLPAGATVALPHLPHLPSLSKAGRGGGRVGGRGSVFSVGDAVVAEVRKQGGERGMEGEEYGGVIQSTRVHSRGRSIF